MHGEGFVFLTGSVQIVVNRECAASGMNRELRRVGMNRELRRVGDE